MNTAECVHCDGSGKEVASMSLDTGEVQYRTCDVCKGTGKISGERIHFTKYPDKSLAIARQLMQQHGKPTEICIAANHDVRVLFNDGYRYVLGGFTVGYKGTGPAFTKVFLRDAGFEVSIDEIVEMKPPVTLVEGQPYTPENTVVIESATVEETKKKAYETVPSGSKIIAMDCFLTRSIGLIDGTWEHNPFNGTRDDIIGEYKDIHHDCPHCGDVASECRSLGYLIKECIKEGKCVYPCNSCGKPFIVPMEIWNKEGIEELRQTEIIPFDEIKLGKLFVENWERVLLEANSKTKAPNITMTYDGKGSCPSCGFSRGYPEIDIRLNCTSCGQDLWVSENIGNSKKDTLVLCSGCGEKLIVPKTAWCSICERHFMPEKMVAKMFLKANRKIKNASQSSESQLPGRSPTMPQKKKLAAIDSIIIIFFGISLIVFGIFYSIYISKNFEMTQKEVMLPFILCGLFGAIFIFKGLRDKKSSKDKDEG